MTTIEQELRDAISERTDHVHAEAPPEAVLTARVGAARRHTLPTGVDNKLQRPQAHHTTAIQVQTLAPYGKLGYKLC